MLKRLLSTIVTLAFVFCGATVAMEALGLLFRDGTTDPEQRLEALIAQIEANTDTRDVPREPEAERLWPLPDARETAEPVQGEEHKTTEIAPLVLSLTHEDKPPAAVVSSEWAPDDVAESQPEAESKALAPSAEEPSPPVVVAAAGTVMRAPAVAVQGAEDCSAGCAAKRVEPSKGPRAAGAERRRAPRAASLSGCPLLGWLEWAMAPAAPPARRTAATGRAI